MEGKRVLLVGIGNSSVDIAENLVTEGRLVINDLYQLTVLLVYSI